MILTKEEKDYILSLINRNTEAISHLFGRFKNEDYSEDFIKEYEEMFFEPIKQTLINAQENEKVLDALKKHLHILPMSDGNDVIGIGCPANEDVIEPNDFGYDIIKELLKDDESK